MKHIAESVAREKKLLNRKNKSLIGGEDYIHGEKSDVMSHTGSVMLQVKRKAINKEMIESYYSLLREIYDNFSIENLQIYNIFR